MASNKINSRGFTLVELLITVIIIGILMVIGVPSYRQFILKSHRSEAISTLTEDQAIIERCYAQNFSYTGTCSALPSFPQTTSNGYYRIAISNLTSTTYTLTATPVGDQTADTTCASFSIDQTNQRTAVDSNGVSQSSCWNT